jgi:SAM-dependent methyltransferase
MIDAIDPQPGDRVLELAAGTGDAGLLAAELIQPGGTLICSDFVPEMLTGAQEWARELGVRNVRFRLIDATSIDEPAASLDGVLCRWGYMLIGDPDAALRETRRVLRPGARLALAAWTAPEENPWSALPQHAVRERGLVEPVEPGAPGQYAWARPGLIAERLEAAGFVEHRVEALAFTQHHASFDAWWASTRDLARGLDDALNAVDAATVAEVREEVRRAAEPYVQPDGSVALPARTWVAAAVA